MQNKDDLNTLLNDVAVVLAQNNLRADLQEALRLAVAIENMEARMRPDARFKQEEYKKFEAWHTKNIPHDPITGASAALRWSGWFTRSQQPTNVVANEKPTNVEPDSGPLDSNGYNRYLDIV